MATITIAQDDHEALIWMLRHLGLEADGIFDNDKRREFYAIEECLEELLGLPMTPSSDRTSVLLAEARFRAEG